LCSPEFKTLVNALLIFSRVTQNKNPILVVGIVGTEHRGQMTTHVFQGNNNMHLGLFMLIGRNILGQDI
jgi:hypothetical protein